MDRQREKGIKGFVCVSEKKGGPRSVVVALGSAHHRSWESKEEKQLVVWFGFGDSYFICGSGLSPVRKMGLNIPDSTVALSE
ncbi:hypothetical protein Csa_004314 [Cucumis sativus]|uniref:Uncharacterized protein n=1 Tax=Cucumis sativus TaxID=3659 RepID=A0A0A0KKW5_CUCSA|nr:hypothetical protein Csa_004314 [Cucumis sativus]